MIDSKVQFRQTTMFPLLVLLFASGIGVVLSDLRLARIHHGLSGNLFLAWLPLVFALGVFYLHRRGERRSLRLGALAALWLLFFPNAPYIFTDLVHLMNWFQFAFWVDLTVVLLVALTGFVVGFVSLYLMQLVVTERFGKVAGWLFILIVAWLSGFGVYLGRFLRKNSWDVMTHPLAFTQSIGHLVAHPLSNRMLMEFPTLFATFLFVGYLMLYALTHLRAEGPFKV